MGNVQWFSKQLMFLVDVSGVKGVCSLQLPLNVLPCMYCPLTQHSGFMINVNEVTDRLPITKTEKSFKNNCHYNVVIVSRQNFCF